MWVDLQDIELTSVSVCNLGGCFSWAYFFDGLFRSLKQLPWLAHLLHDDGAIRVRLREVTRSKISLLRQLPFSCLFVLLLAFFLMHDLFIPFVCLVTAKACVNCLGLTQATAISLLFSLLFLLQMHRAVGVGYWYQCPPNGPGSSHSRLPQPHSIFVVTFPLFWTLMFVLTQYHFHSVMKGTGDVASSEAQRYRAIGSLLWVPIADRRRGRNTVT